MAEDDSRYGISCWCCVMKFETGSAGADIANLSRHRLVGEWLRFDLSKLDLQRCCLKPLRSPGATARNDVWEPPSRGF
jgi:hypothetical protein